MSIKYLSFSPQLGYVLGFANPQHVQNNEIAKYGCDLRGGFSSFAIYAKGLTENMIVGNSLSSLLRIASPFLLYPTPLIFSSLILLLSSFSFFLLPILSSLFFPPPPPSYSSHLL
ncbi:unnamed protein product [Meloidogyne enterolobii]|uniref:Uncharacterized protein n=1 Tax=Meloidogyne enterolobii TaxID=390850 RepID=A0ACB0XX60_MELEN